MLLWDESESIGWARVTRGIASMLKLVVRFATSARTRSGFVSGCNVPMSAAPSRSSPISSGVGFWTFSTTSAPSAAARSVATVAPAARYASSSCDAPAPAPDSTMTSDPAFTSFATASGTSATRRSPAVVSRGTPIFTSRPARSAARPQPGAWRGRPQGSASCRRPEVSRSERSMPVEEPSAQRHGAPRRKDTLDRRRSRRRSIAAPEGSERVGKTLITGGTVVTAADTYKADVLVDGEKVAAIGTDLQAGGAKKIDAKGKYVIPGGIDVHTHMELPFGGTFASDDFETGTIAAAFGGTTSIVDFAVQGMGEPLAKARDAWLAKARGKAAVDYGLHMIVRDVSDKILREMDTMVRDGISSFKLFMAYPGVFMVDDAAIFKALVRTGENGGLIWMHAENGGVIDVLVKKALAAKHTQPKWHALTRPPEAEGEATGRAFWLAEMAGGVPLYIVHLSAAHALEQVRLFRDRGLPAYAETCPQYLFLSIDNYDEPGFDGAKYVMSPPLREKWHQEELWKGLARNDLQVIRTDHCPFCMKEGFQGRPKQKELGIGDFSKIPNGAPGVETRMYLTS